MTIGRAPDRRAVLRFLAASPALEGSSAASALFAMLAQSTSTPVARGQLAPRERRLAAPDDVVITSVKEALTILDFYNVARAKYPPLHHFWYTNNYYNETVYGNVEGFSRYSLRRRMLTGIDQIDLSVS